VIRPQLPLVEDRARRGLRNHDQVARALNQSPWLHVPPPLPQETRAPDSLQFLLQDFSDDEALKFQDAVKKRGVSVQVFGLSKDNARAFWNWKFIGPQGALPGTQSMLRKAVDTRLPARLTESDCDYIARAILDAAAEVKDRAAVAAE
jgi:dTDP-4-amino-4,6-dideoxygalactose transaminase